MANLDVSVVLGLVDRLSGPLRGVTGAFDRLRDGVDRVAAMSANATFIGGALTQAGGQLTAPLQEAVALAMQVQSGLTEVGIVAGKTAAEVGAIRPELRALSAEYGQSQVALVETLGAMTAKGLSFDQSFAALPEAARAAAALKAELADMEGTAAAVIQQLGVDPARLSDPFNRMAAAANAGGFEVRDMARYFPELAASMAKVGTGADAVGTLAAALQVVRAGAGSAGEAATQMGDLLEKMFAPATVDALEKKFGVDLPAAMQQWRAEGRDVFDEFIGLIQRVTGGDAFKVADIFGDKESRAGLLSLMNNWETFERIRAEAAAAPSVDLLGKLFGQRLAEDPALRLARLAESAANLRVQIGTALLPVIERLVPGIERLVAAVGDWIDRNPALASTLAAVAAGLGGFMVVGGGLVTALAGIVGGVAILALSLRSLGFGALLAGLRGVVGLGGGAAGALRGVGMALRLNPVGLFVTALAIAAQAVYQHWEPISGFFTGLWQGLTDGLAPLQPAFAAAWGGVTSLLEPVIAALGGVFGWLGQLLAPVQGTGAAATAMGQAWGTAIANMIGKVAELVAAVAGLAQRMWQAGSDIVQGLWDGLMAKWQGLQAWWTEKTAWFSNIFAETNEIQSPSRVFAALGGDLMRGLQAGIEGVAGAPLAAVRTIAAGVAAVPLALAPLAAPAGPLALAPLAAPAGPLAALLAAVGAAPGQVDALRHGAVVRPATAPVAGRRPARGDVHMPITISVQASPGMDEHRLVALIESRLREAGGQVARHLSALYDDPDEV
jgi:TP901 family phage tail tape measure protein